MAWITEMVDRDLKNVSGNYDVDYVIENYDLYCRYSVSNTLNDMKDALWFLHMCYFNNKLNLENSNRFKKIYVKEEAPDQIHWV